MFSLKYQISNPESWHQEMAKQIPIETSGNSFLLQNSFGSGGGQFVALQPGLWIEQLESYPQGAIVCGNFTKTTQ